MLPNLENIIIEYLNRIVPTLDYKIHCQDVFFHTKAQMLGTGHSGVLAPKKNHAANCGQNIYCVNISEL